MVCWSAGQNKRFIKNRGYWQRAGLGSPLTQEDELYLVFKRYNMVSFKAMRLVERGGLTLCGEVEFRACGEQTSAKWNAAPSALII